MFDTKAASDRLRAIGLTTNQSQQLLDLISKWSRSNGEEWTVKRIKDIKILLLRAYSGLVPHKTDSWIKVSPRGLKGPFGVLFRMKDFRKAWNLIMVYTGFVFDHPDLRVTAKQWKKAILAIKRENLQPSALIKSLEVIHKSPFYVSVTVMSETGSPLIDYQCSPSRRAPKEWETVPEQEGVIDSIRPLIRKTLWTVQNWDILSGTLRGLENSIVPDLELNLEDEAKAGGEPSDDEWVPEMGHISLIQEGGYKLRFVANPYRVYQMALQPLGDALFSALKRVPNDFTFDQEAGKDFVRSALQSGLPAASMDLSNATDNAPLEAQLALLSRLGVSTRWLQFFKSCCQGSWYTSQQKHHKSWEKVRWTVGTPLGLYPTFAAFAMWHHAVAQAALEQSGAQPVEIAGRLVWPYAILGDDIVFFDIKASVLYREWMQSWGIPIADEKSLTSDTTAEFLGCVITANSVVPGFKWKAGVSDQNFIDLARCIGPGALIFMKPRQRGVISFIADLPYPYGLGWNPLGVPLEKRLTNLIETIWSADVRLRTFSRRAENSTRLLYSSSDLSGTPIIGREADVEVLTSDQLVDEVVHELLPGWESGPWLWPNLTEIALFQGTSRLTSEKLRLSLRRNSYVETRKEATALVVQERKIRRWLARSRAVQS